MDVFGVMQSNRDDTESSAGESGLLTQSRRGVLKLTGGGLGAMAVGGTLVESASAAVTSNSVEKCLQVDFVTGTSTETDLSTTTYSDNGRLINWRWGEVDGNTGEDDNKETKNDTCDITTDNGVEFDFGAGTATVNYNLSNCGGDQDLLLVSYEAPCNGSPPNPAWDPANADQQTVFDSATATTQSNGSLTVNIPSKVAYYSLDESSLPPSNAVTGTDASVTGSPTTGENGIKNTAFGFDESGSNDRDTTTDALTSGQNLPLNGSEATVGAWFRYTTKEDFARVYQIGSTVNETPTSGGWDVEFDSNTDDLKLVTWTSANSGTANSSGTITLASDTWYFAVGVVDGSDGTMYVFDQNGELSASPVTTSGRDQTGNEPLILMGGDNSDAAGRMDEVYALSTALSASEVTTLYNNSF
jgi:hypothetical protein